MHEDAKMQPDPRHLDGTGSAYRKRIMRYSMRYAKSNGKRRIQKDCHDQVGADHLPHLLVVPVPVPVPDRYRDRYRHRYRSTDPVPVNPERSPHPTRDATVHAPRGTRNASDARRITAHDLVVHGAAADRWSELRSISSSMRGSAPLGAMGKVVQTHQQLEENTPVLWVTAYRVARVAIHGNDGRTVRLRPLRWSHATRSPMPRIKAPRPDGLPRRPPQWQGVLHWPHCVVGAQQARLAVDPATKGRLESTFHRPAP